MNNVSQMLNKLTMESYELELLEIGEKELPCEKRRKKIHKLRKRITTLAQIINKKLENERNKNVLLPR